MTEYMTRDAREISIQAYENAIRLGHRYLGGEHFLLALAAAEQPSCAVLRERGVTPGRVEAEIIRLSGAGLLGDLDRDALAAIGVDVDVVRARIEASFGGRALTRAAQAAHREPGRFNPRRRSGAVRDGVFLPHTPDAHKILLSVRREPGARHAAEAGVEHLALAIVGSGDGLVPVILSALGVPAQALGAAILDRYRQAS